jgi:cell wall-associated NlpC family hydrolase
MTTKNQWSKLHFRSADGVKEETMFAVNGDYEKDVDRAKKEVKSTGYKFLRLSKTKFDCYGDIIK